MTRSRLDNAAITGAGVSIAPILAAHAAHASRGESLRDVAPETLTRSPWQPRTAVDRGEEFTALVDSIGAHGVLEPLLVRELAAGALELLAGERRLEAAKAAGLALVPVRVLVGLTDAGARAIAITENLARKDLTAWEEAHAVRHLRDARRDEGLPSDVRALAPVAGRSKSLVAQLLRIADTLTPDVLEMARREAGGALVQSLDTLPHATLDNAASAGTEAERARRLALVLGPPAVTATTDRAPRLTESPAPFRTNGTPAGRFAFRLTAAVDTLSAADAAAALEALAPVVKALKARTREAC